MMKALDKSQHPSKKLSEALFVGGNNAGLTPINSSLADGSSGHEHLNLKYVIIFMYLGKNHAH